MRITDLKSFVMCDGWRNLIFVKLFTDEGLTGLGERTAEGMAERAGEVVRRGYTALKIDPFGAGAMELQPAERRRCLEIVAAVRDAVGPDVDLLIEGHGRFAPTEAKRLARELAPYDPGWFEEPCPWDDPLAWREVKAASTIPIAGGEH